MTGKHRLAEQLHRDQVLATRALAAMMLNGLPEQMDSRAQIDAKE
jgi:hypothetical protein